MELNSIVALDLGSSQIKVVVGRPLKDDFIEIIGQGTSVCDVIKGGAVTNIETTVRSIREAIDKAELMAGLEIREVVVNLSGKTIRAGNHKTTVAIPSREKVVREEDINRVIEAILSITPIPPDQEIVHVLTKEFSVDDQTNIKTPLGMTGLRLEGEAHIVTVGSTSKNNLEKCIKNANLELYDMILSSFASSEAVLTSSEKELGTAVVDIGGGITDIVIYKDGGVAYSSVVPIGGSNITKDLSIGLKTSPDAAEMIKKEFGQATRKGIDPTEKIEIPPLNGRPSMIILKQDLIRIIEARVEEIFEYVNQELEKSGIKSSLSGGVILTGGSSKIPGIETVASEILGLSVIRAKPTQLAGLFEQVASPEYSTAVGLIKYIARSPDFDSEYEDTNRYSSAGHRGGNIKDKVIGWIKDNL
ncbi:MAG: cell division protein FtsA [Leptospiraceae bacterium]|nr:cell division protein FtsA [Leptospiraceae bacterium]MCP5510578.1 cell division protein FtsA [Leptospiraceae bacterium]